MKHNRSRPGYFPAAVAAAASVAAALLAFVKPAGTAQGPAPPATKTLPIYDPRFVNDKVSYSLVKDRVVVDVDLSLGTVREALWRSWKLAIRTAKVAVREDDAGKRPVDRLLRNEGKPDGVLIDKIVRLAGQDPNKFPDKQEDGEKLVRFANEALRPLQEVRRPGKLPLDREEARTIFAGASREFIWPNGRVPYVLDRGLSDKVKEIILEAMRHWMARTKVGEKSVITFQEVVPAPDKDYVRFVPAAGPPGSEAYGRKGGEQCVYLCDPPACEVQQVIHEIGHVVGLLHEHTRHDRDKYLRVITENLGMYQAQFEEPPIRADDPGEFDWRSIMLYPPRAFSTNTQPTLVMLVPPMDEKWGIASGPEYGGVTKELSDGDVAAVRVLYSVPGK